MSAFAPRQSESIQKLSIFSEELYMKNNMNPYDGLANAIILHAVKDYRVANKKLSRGRKNMVAQQMKDECLRFFRSHWFSVLTEVDPEFLIRRLDEEAEHDG